MTGGGSIGHSASAATEEKSCRRLDLIKEENIIENGNVIVSARLESDRGEPQRIWFELPEEFFHMTTASMDPFVIATIFQTMKEPTKLHVRGEVSATLLRNLAEFQSVWKCWLPSKYTPAEISVSKESEQAEGREARAIAAFSGGVDSTYTVWRHTTGGVGRRGKNIEAGLFVHGFDIPLDQEEQFKRAAGVAETTLASAGVKLIRMKSNLYDPDWEMTHGAAIAACLTLLKGHFAVGLIASTYSYHYLDLPWGSNPITDPLLSSDDFNVVHDSADVRRDDKEVEVSKWKEGFDNLHVCYEASDRDKNCCRCAKCLMLYFSLKAQGIAIPASFDQEISAQEVLKCTGMNEGFSQAFAAMAKKYEERGLGKEPWFAALKRCADYNRRRIVLEKPLSSPLKDWLRRAKLRRHVRRGP